MNDERPTFGSLFAGIGGIDLGLERAGWECRFQVEWDPFCQRVLAKHWPDVPRYGDITAVDWTGVERVDLLAGGFPCQPVSFAGKGLAQGDERWLWPAFHRAICELRPRYVLVENVPGLLARGMGDVLGDLATSGYNTEWDCIPAASVGALHLRDRVWIVAHDDRRDWGAPGQSEAQAGATGHPVNGGRPHTAPADMAYPDGHGLNDVGGREASDERPARTPALSLGERWDDRRPGSHPGSRRLLGSALAYANGGDAQGFEPERDAPEDWREPPQRPTGLFHGARADRAWPAEPDVGRVAHGVPARVDRLRSLGNAVVPQVVEMIGRQLLAHPQQSIEGSVT